MQKTNWIILASKDRGIDYGVGTFIKQLYRGTVKRANKMFTADIMAENYLQTMKKLNQN